MAEVTIRFRHNAKTGKRELVIAYESDDDALAHEHERDHRALVEALLGVPVTADMGDIVVERVAKQGADDEPSQEAAQQAAPARAAKAEPQGG